MPDITRLLEDAVAGDPTAANELLPLVYEELRKLAAEKMAREQPGQTLQTTALVHEAYVRLVGSDRPKSWNGRRHFIAAAAKAMRHILVERARQRRRVKHGGNAARVELSESALAAPGDSDEVVAVHEALDRLAAVDEQAAEVVKLRYFAGMSNAEVAAALEVSPRTADRLWAYARAWLRDAIQRAEKGGSASQ